MVTQSDILARHICNRHQTVMTAFPKLFLVFCFHVVAVRSEVVDDFSNCNQYFYKTIPPRIEGYFREEPKRICQKFNDEYHYATLYSTTLRIPVFTAYTLPAPCPGNQDDRRKTWFIEPQVICLQFLSIFKQ